jgi:hypothetical protein
MNYLRMHCCWAPVAHAYNPSYSGGRDKEDKASLGKYFLRPYLEVPNTKKDWHSESSGRTPSSKCEALSSNSSTAKKKREREQECLAYLPKYAWIFQISTCSGFLA